MSILLRNGLIFYDRSLIEGDILVNGEKIEEVGDLSFVRADIEVDLKGRLVLPGIIDSHTHFGLEMLGFRSPDDFNRGTLSALYGGVTTVLDFTEQERGESLISSFNRRVQEAKGKSWVDYSLHINLTDFSTSWREEIGALIDKGIVSFKFFTAYRKRGLMAEDRELFEAFSIIRDLGGLAMVHSEWGDIIDILVERFIGLGKTEPLYHALSRPSFTEAEAISRVLYIAEATGCPIYIVHVTTREGLDEIRRAKNRGVKVSAEVCLHHLLLNEEKLKGDGGIYFIVTPPLRTSEDNDALWEGIFDGTVDVISTDHASYSKAQKEGGYGVFYKTPSGLPGVEHLFPLIFTEGYLKRGLPIERMVELLAINPARIFKLKGKGVLMEGFDADILVVDSEREITVAQENLHGGVDYSPYEGFRLRGFPWLLMQRGEILLREGKLLANSPKGRFISLNN